MKHPLLGALVVLSLAAPAMAQKYTAPRTPDGQPSLEGFWNSATYTPFERPANMKEDEAAVYDFCTQLHRAKKVDNANFKRVKDLCGEQGVIDLVGVCG